MSRILLRSASVVLCILPVSGSGSYAQPNRYIESFNTTTYKDAANTTAFWDVVCAELKLVPFVPSLTGTYDTPTGTPLGVAVAGDLAFVGFSNGLQIINITNLASPSLVGTYIGSGFKWGVAVAGDLAFVANNPAGLQIINITNPASPSVVGTFQTPGGARGVVVVGDLAFVADHDAGLHIIDITNPASPLLVGTYNTPWGAYGVAVVGDLAFVADGATGLLIVDIANPASPSLVGTYNTPGDARGVTVAGDLAFVADVSGLQIINVTNPASPSLVGTYDTPGQAYGVTVAGDLAFVADYTSGLQIIDIADPASPSLVGTYDTPGHAWRVVVAGEHAFMTDDVSGLQIIKVTSLALPRLVGTYDTPDLAYGVAVDGDLAFVADNASGLQIIDIADPASPSLVGTYDTPDLAYGVAVDGDLAFVADNASGLQIIDIADPASPSLVGTYNTPGSALGVAVAGDLAFVADFYTFRIISIANPASPSLVSIYGTLSARGVAVAGDLAFVADDASGLQIITIANPAIPLLVGSYDTPGNAYGVAVAGDLAFVADDASGLQIIDITNPASPSLVGTYDTPGFARGVAVAGDFAFVADQATGLQIINIANPASPLLVGTYDAPDFANAVSVDGDLAFVADGASGLHAIEVFNHELNTLNNIGRSLKVNAIAGPVVAVRLSTTQTSSGTWEMTADAGTNWQGITPDDAWNLVANESNDLRWRSTHTLAGWPGSNPTVSDLQTEWLYEFALIDAITDIPNDQGGWVRLSAIRSGRDFAAEASLPIANYGVWRRVDNMVLVAALASAPRDAEAVDPLVAKAFGALRIFGFDGRAFTQSAPGEMSATLPPGTWELVQTIPALQQQTYLAAIPTTEDSTQSGTNHTVLVVTAHTTTPSIWYVSPVDSGYSVDNIAPSVPSSFTLAYNTGSGNTLSWGPSPDSDFQYFRVYRSTDPTFTPSPGTLVHSTISTGWVDPNFDISGYHYKVTALDYAGNESGAATAGTVTAVGDPVMPRTFALYPNVPNPFNPTTVVRYDVPEGGGSISLRIYDASGRVVRSLVEGTQTAGQKTMEWDGRDDGGRPVASGVYFCRFTAPNYTMTHKMVLMK